MRRPRLRRQVRDRHRDRCGETTPSTSHELARPTHGSHRPDPWSGLVSHRSGPPGHRPPCSGWPLRPRAAARATGTFTTRPRLPDPLPCAGSSAWSARVETCRPTSHPELPYAVTCGSACGGLRMGKTWPNGRMGETWPNGRDIAEWTTGAGSEHGRRADELRAFPQVLLLRRAQRHAGQVPRRDDRRAGRWGAR